ncbi:hypothetical protein NLG97_g7443 [Lecanicillium saksenae]|uniref:Uncharacterized protein n=1 Tax=Lecanicillium saksenae TaxID=468837 RepID=A0ACC1QME5_9HYPO|nr:hypothetical protein NLG97_g7443 [Lecanicillium saksenae]
MAETSQSHLSSAPLDTITNKVESTNSALQNPQSLEPESKSPSSVANRVCTPLGLFVHPSERGPPMSMPRTLTPESTPASPRRHEKATASTSPIRQPGASPTRSRVPVSDCMRKRTDSMSDAIRAAAASAQSNAEDAPSPLVPAGETQPLHTGTVLANTKMVHPKPINRVVPADITSRPGTASSVAQLEMTAQQLSMTSSIDDAIRDLHGELKRSDSRRSSILAASVKTGDASGSATPGQLQRHLSTSSSIVSTNIAARQGGYSPAAFVKSPGSSGNGRLIPGSLTAVSLPEPEIATVLSRHGPGKSSVRSVRSAKLSLADISESEPIALTQTVLDEADNAPPLDMEPTIPEAHAYDQGSEQKPSTDAFHEMMQSGATQQPAFSFATERHAEVVNQPDPLNRPETSHSQDTYHQAQHAFFDFDGVHCAENRTDAGEEEEDDEPMTTEGDYIAVDQHLAELEDDVFDLPPLQLPHGLPSPPQPPAFSYGDDSIPQPPAPVGLIRPQSYFDPASGVQMNYYPARVPAALNIPQKLSNKPKANERNSRQSKVLSAMLNSAYHPANEDADRRASAMPALGDDAQLKQGSRPIKERHHERRPSFLPLSTEDMLKINEPLPEAAEPAEPAEPAHESCDNLASTLRIPKRISEPKAVDKRKSKMSMINLPSQLRASAYFDAPAVTTDMEAKDGSAMNALDDILDAGASAPVGAFTDHLYAGKLGSEVYGATKKKSVASSPSLRPPSSEHSGKKRSSWMPLGRRSHSYNSQDSPEQGEEDPPHLTGDSDSDHVIRVPAGPVNHNGDHIEEEAEEGEEIEEYMGAPTTLLAELQLRKQQQKERIQNKVRDAHGTQATLLELDTVAENQRLDRKNKRVNLAWEDPEAHLDQNGSDDEDVPLAIIAARQQGAKNMADLERPLGLIEKREIEENEPLSKRRARLQGLDNTFTTPRPQSMLMAPARRGDTRPRQSMISLNLIPPEDIEGETLADRRKRLASEADKENELSLPPTRPVSTAFSAELLSQFDPVEAGRLEGSADGKDAKRSSGAPEEEETLGQRRRRLQAEKAARQQEMAHGATATGSTGNNKERRMSMASVLSAHPRKSPDLRVQEEMQRREEEERVARENEAKMAAMRVQMPSNLAVPGVVQQRGFQNGMYNNGYGGRVVNPRPITAQVAGQGQFNRPNSMAFNQGPQQGIYMNPYAAGSAHAFGTMNMYNNGMNGAYGGMQPNNQMQMPHGGSMDRVEMWRQGVFP